MDKFWSESQQLVKRYFLKLPKGHVRKIMRMEFAIVERKSLITNIKLSIQK